ncbi:hypothetical protein ABFS83_08G192300 [Erythranthe nasuta]
MISLRRSSNSTSVRSSGSSATQGTRHPATLPTSRTSPPVLGLSIPLIYNEPLELRNEKLNLVNGVIFTGKSGVYFDVVKSIFENVRRKNDAGHHFPLLAICLGFELLTMIVSEDENIMQKFNAKNHASKFQSYEKT